MKQQIKLDYTIPEGSLKPYFEALACSKALASRCKACGRVAFPARIVCGVCNSDHVEWTALSGLATLVHRTDGVARSFALMKFAGADTLSTVALLNPTLSATTGRLQSPADGRSGLWVQLVEIAAGANHV